MKSAHHPPQTEEQPAGVLRFRYIPVYEMVAGLAFGFIGIIASVALIGGLIFGSNPSLSDLTITIAAAIIGLAVAVASFRNVSTAWVSVKIKEDIEVHRCLRRSTQHIATADAQAVRLSMSISPIFGMRSEATLVLSENEQAEELPVLRSIFPSQKFRRDSINLARALKIQLEIPLHDSIPLGFRAAFDTLRPYSRDLPSSVLPQTKQESDIEPLIENLLLSPITWQATGDGEFPHRVDFDGQACEIRVNDWPEHETVYSLIIAGQSVHDLHTLPDHWKRPDAKL